VNEKMNEQKSIEFLKNAMSRRGFLGAAGAVAVGGALAACGTGGSTPAAGGASTGAAAFPADVSDTEKVVRWANWPLYLDYDEDAKTYPTLDAFAAASGIAPTYKEEIDDNATFWGKVNGQLKTGQDIGFDVVTPTDWMASRFIQYGYAQPLDAAKIPNKVNILDNLANVSFDKGRNYSLTWQSGFGGLVWNKEKLPNGLQSVDQLWSDELKGKVTVLSEMRDTMGIILKSLGIDIANGITEDQWQQGLEFLGGKLDDGSIYKVQGNEYAKDLVSGQAWAGIVWSGDIFILNAENDDKWGFALPESGGMLWSDNMLIPSTSSHQSNAMAMMNHYYDPAVAAQVAAYVNYICPVKGAQEEMEKIDPALAASEFIFPSAETLTKASVFPALDSAAEQSFSDSWATTTGV
jgi:spermidine/putrescine transport system substrate-binding protein